ncbi:MAG: GntR family transcriptional regulator [Acidobacteriota bacterium]
MIQIATGDPRPIFRQIVDGLRLKIASGELPPNTKLPSVRALAMQLMVNPNTVVKAYGQLTDEGLIESRERVGVFVCEPRQRFSDDERSRRLDEAMRHFVGAVVSLGFDTDDILDRLAEHLRAVNFHERESRDPSRDPE